MSFNRKEYNKNYHLKHKDTANAKSSLYYYQHKDRLLKGMSDKYKKNKSNPEYMKKILECGRRSYRKRREYVLSWEREYFKRQRFELFAILGGAFCRKCGFDDYRALHIDHINGGGNEERRRLKTGRMVMNDVRKHPEKYQVLCANCNFIKKYENREFRKNK